MLISCLDLCKIKERVALESLVVRAGRERLRVAGS
jgi:hypothetical protein